jgi:hypothetical protein
VDETRQTRMNTDEKRTVPLLYVFDFVMNVSLQEEPCIGTASDKVKWFQLYGGTFTYFRPHIKLLVMHAIQIVQL